MRALALLSILLLVACGGGENKADNAANSAPAEQRDSKTDGERRARRLYNETERLFRQGDFEASIPLLEEATSLAPRDWEIQARLGDALESLGRHAEALAQFEIAAKLASGSDRNELHGRMARCSHSLAFAAYAAKENKLALEHLRDGLKLLPADADMNLLMGYTLVRLEQYEGAEQAFAIAAAGFGQPQRFEAEFWRAQTLTHQEKHERAVAAYTALIEQGVTSNDVYGWRAYSQFALGHAGEARRDFVSALEYASSPAKRREFEEQLKQLARSNE